MEPFIQEEAELWEAVAALQSTVSASKERLQRKAKHLEELTAARVALSSFSGASQWLSEDASTSASEAAEVSVLVKLNVGGDTSFVTRRDTLTAIEGSRLAQLFSGRWDKVLPKDRDGRIFLDLDPVQFWALLSWLVDTKRMAPGGVQDPPPVETLPPEYQVGFLEICDLLCSKDEAKSGTDEDLDGGIMDDLPNHIDGMSDSQILNDRDLEQLKTWLKQPACPSRGSTAQLLYRASRDGWYAEDFHLKCDGKGATVVIAKSVGGHIFGGYAEKSWDSSNTWKECRQSFLFALSNPDGAEASQHLIFQNFCLGMLCDHSEGLGPCFGGRDLYFMHSQAVLGSGHCHSTLRVGADGEFKFLAESNKVTLQDYEVYVLRPQETYESVKQSLALELSKHTQHLNAVQHDFLEKALAISQAALSYCQRFSQHDRSLSGQCKATNGEVEFMRRFLRDPGEQSMVRLNVSGVVMETFRSTLLWQEGSSLAARFGGPWTVQKDEMVDGGIFFDEDPSLFSLLLLHLRLGSLLGESFLPDVPEGKLRAWRRFLRYHNLEGAFAPHFPNIDEFQ